jgi:large subunit ribosomal protein L22
MTNIPTILAISKSIRIAPKKIQKILSLLKGKTYKEALTILLPLKTKCAISIWKTLFSAASNANNNLKLKKEFLIIKEAFVTRGTILKRIQPRARGKAYRIEKIFSHLTIKLTIKQ